MEDKEAEEADVNDNHNDEDDDFYTAPPPHSPCSGASSSTSFSLSSRPPPPPFSSLVFGSASSLLPPPPPPPPLSSRSVEDLLPEESEPSSSLVADTKASFSQDPKGDSPGKSPADDGEPPPPYTEGYSPLESFTYVMATAGGASSIITQVQQTGGPPINTLGGTNAKLFLSIPSISAMC